MEWSADENDGFAVVPGDYNIGSYHNDEYLYQIPTGMLSDHCTFTQLISLPTSSPLLI